MSKLNEVEEAFRVIKKYNSKKLYILQCTSEYPCPSNNLNLDVLKIYRINLKIVVSQTILWDLKLHYSRLDMVLEF